MTAALLPLSPDSTIHLAVEVRGFAPGSPRNTGRPFASVDIVAVSPDYRASTIPTPRHLVNMVESWRDCDTATELRDAIARAIDWYAGGHWREHEHGRDGEVTR